MIIVKNLILAIIAVFNFVGDGMYCILLSLSPWGKEYHRHLRMVDNSVLSVLKMAELKGSPWVAATKIAKSVGNMLNNKALEVMVEESLSRLSNQGAIHSKFIHTSDSKRSTGFVGVYRIKKYD